MDAESSESFYSRFREMDANGDGGMDSQDTLLTCQCLPGNIPGNHPIEPQPFLM